MDSVIKEKPDYEIPFKQHSKVKWYFHLSVLLLILFFSIFFLIPSDNDLEVMVLKVMSCVFILSFAYYWTYVGILKKTFLQLTNEQVIIKTLFGTKKIKWKEIYTIEVFTQNHNTILGIISKEKVKKRKQSFWSAMSEMFGGLYSIQIPLSQFSDIDIDRLYSTMSNKIAETYEHSCGNYAENSESLSIGSDEVKLQSCAKVLMECFLLCLVIGIGYGISLHLLKSNFFLIPLFGTMGILYVYSTKYNELKVNWFTRVFIGMLCALQCVIALVVLDLASTTFKLTASYVALSLKVCIYNLIHLHSNYIPMLIIMLVCFICGAVQNNTFRFQRKFKKMFMKKLGNLFYKKDGRIISIYAVDPASYDDSEKGKLFMQIDYGCLVEKSNNTLSAVYIPKRFLDNANFTLKNCTCKDINNETYCVIGNGGNGQLEPYVLPCVLITDAKKNVELIQIEMNK